MRENLRIVAVGHVDHGKSTIIGRILYDTKSISDGVINKVKKVCLEKGKDFEYAFLLDAFEEEQNQGITIDTTEIQFKTENRDYTIIDAPGHKEFLKNMISGAASAEAALLIIDSNEGIKEQSKRHGYILSLLGIKQVYVIVNKMDLIGYDEEKFNEIVKEMNEFLKELQVYPKKYIPVSAYYGENISNTSDKLKWYKGENIIEALDKFEKEKSFDEKELRFPIQDVYKFDDRRIIAGRIESGKIKEGDEVLIYPSNRKNKVKSIEYFIESDRREVEVSGRSIGITLEEEFFNKRGEIIVGLSNKPLTSKFIKVNIVWMGKESLKKNKKYKLKLVTQEVECEIYEINKVIDATTLEEKENINEVKINDVAEIIIKTKETLTFDKFSDNNITGRFVIVDNYNVSGGGIIIDKEEAKERFETIFKKDDIEIKIDILDEYYYNIQNGSIKKLLKESNLYKVGDTIKLSGDTFNYKDNLDIISLEKNIVIKIRNKIFKELIYINNYIYEGFDIVNDNGFKIKINSDEDLKKYIEEFNSLVSLNHKVINFNNKWLEITSFKNIKFI